MSTPQQHLATPLNCAECDAPLVGKYCHECGEKPPDAHDLSIRHFIQHGVHEFTHFDSKIFRTLQTLIFKPGVLSADYLAGRKQRYVLPLRLFLVIFAINAFLYTRPGAALYDVRFIFSATAQGKDLEARFEKRAAKNHLTKDAFVDQMNEHWQHNVSLFQLADVFVFAVFLALINRRRYFVEHLIFSLHTLSFSFLFGSVTWLYYWRYGFKQNFVLIGVSLAVLVFYLWRAIPKMYGTTGWHALLQSFLFVIGLLISRGFFVSFTVVVAFIQTLWKH